MDPSNVRGYCDGMHSGANIRLYHISIPTASGLFAVSLDKRNVRSFAEPSEIIFPLDRFAIFVRQAEIPLLADILNSYSLDALEEMHLATRIVWRAFLYHPSFIPMDYGTLDLALRSLWLKIMERRAVA